MHEKQIVNRDIKSSNILINSDLSVKICDFGLARGTASDREVKFTEYVVTRGYRAPELLCESDMYGTPVDVWVRAPVLTLL